MFDEFSRNDTSIRLISHRWHGVVTTQTYRVLCKPGQVYCYWWHKVHVGFVKVRALLPVKRFQFQVQGWQLFLVACTLDEEQTCSLKRKWTNMGTNLKRGNNTCCFGFLCKNWYKYVYVYVCAQYRCTAKWSFGRVHSCWKSSQQLQIVIVWTIPWCSVWRKLISHPSGCIPHQMIFYSNWQHPHSGHCILNLLGTKSLSLISGSTS